MSKLFFPNCALTSQREWQPSWAVSTTCLCSPGQLVLVGAALQNAAFETSVPKTKAGSLFYNLISLQALLTELLRHKGCISHPRRFLWLGGKGKALELDSATWAIRVSSTLFYSV